MEQSIRDRSADQNVAPAVEDMMSQLFELVNEKNELEKRQSELTYLRRQHHLEQEHADLEYSIRCLMLCPEANKTDSDKELEEQLIQRCVSVSIAIIRKSIREYEEHRPSGKEISLL